MVMLLIVINVALVCMYLPLVLLCLYQESVLISFLVPVIVMVIITYWSIPDLLLIKRIL